MFLGLRRSALRLVAATTLLLLVSNHRHVGVDGKRLADPTKHDLLIEDPIANEEANKERSLSVHGLLSRYNIFPPHHSNYDTTAPKQDEPDDSSDSSSNDSSDDSSDSDDEEYYYDDNANVPQDGANDDTATPSYHEFTPAASLDVFKNIDPNEFEWVNRDNIKAGSTTCGFLKPDLGSEPGVSYPKIKVYICVKFATNQPAPKGNLFIHCGGPSSLSDCAVSIGQDNEDNYNIISIDQRGLGRSMPTFYHQSCDFDKMLDSEMESLDAAIAMGILNVTSFLDGNKYTEEYIRVYLDVRKQFVQSCWTTPEFNLGTIEQPDGSMRQFHFLEYSGTRQLVEDMGRFMVLIEAPKLSLYGISYGTTVMGTFATMFPNFANLFIVDGSVTPYNTMEYYAYSDSVALQLRDRYLEYTCWAAKLKNPESCPIEDIGKCITDFRKLGVQGSIENFLQFTSDNSHKIERLCEAAAKGDAETINELLGLNEPQRRDLQEPALCDGPHADQPSDEDQPICFDAPISVAGLVNGQDFAGSVAAYDDDIFIQKILRFQDDYNTGGRFYMDEMSYNYYWPKNVPLPIRGNPEIRGIVSGQLYDYATPYIWTSEMRGQFPYTSLLTSQGIQHGLRGGPDAPCQKYIVDYLKTGEVNFTDGTVCGDQFEYFGGAIR